MRVGIDLGGSKIEGIALDGSREIARVRVDTPRHDYDATVRAIASVVTDLEHTSGTRGTVGVGIPGTIAPESGLVKNANSTWLLGRPLKTDLEHALGREVRIANDANCLAVSEATDGAAAGADVVFETPGPPCYCGKHGCIETFLSGPGLARDHERRSGRRVPAIEIAALAASGDVAAIESMTCYEHRMARALAAIINIIDPDVIVLGGGLSNIDRLYANVTALWGEYIFAAGVADVRPRTRLVRAAHGDSSGVRGAAWLWPPSQELGQPHDS